MDILRKASLYLLLCLAVMNVTVILLRFTGCGEGVFLCEWRAIMYGIAGSIMMFMLYLMLSVVLYEFVKINSIGVVPSWFYRLLISVAAVLFPMSIIDHGWLVDEVWVLPSFLLVVLVFSDPLEAYREVFMRVVGVSDKFWGKYPPTRPVDLLRPVLITLFYCFLFPFVL